MRFEERELKPYAEPVLAPDLKEGSVYFAVQYLDEGMLTPEMEALIFIGKNLGQGDVGQLYFQDAVSSAGDSSRFGVQPFFPSPQGAAHQLIQRVLVLENVGYLRLWLSIDQCLTITARQPVANPLPVRHGILEIQLA